MQLRTYLFTACLFLICCYTKTDYNHPGADLVANAHQALAYCKQTQNAYVVIVWPKGFHHLDYITKTLNQHGSVKYVQKLILNKSEMFFLYRKLHKHMSYESAKKYFKPYTKSSSCKSFPMAALIFHTKAPLEKIIDWKKEIRDYIGKSYYSIHINDYYYPGTIESAHALLKLYSHIKHHENIRGFYDTI